MEVEVLPPKAVACREGLGWLGIVSTLRDRSELIGTHL